MSALQIQKDVHMARRLTFLCCAIVLLTFAHGESTNTALLGIWLTQDGEGWIEFRIQDGAPAGFIAGSPQDPDRLKPPRLDDRNPDPELRDRPLFGLRIVRILRELEDGRWKGQIYDPNSGKTYKCTLTLVDDNTLKFRGYQGISLLGRTEVWTKKR